MLFDPVKARFNGFQKEMLDFYLGTQYEEGVPMGNIAASELGTVIKAWLVGLHREIHPVIRRSNEWLDLSIKNDEIFGPVPNAYRTTLHWARAMGSWLEGGVNDEKEWDAARQYEESRWGDEAHPWAMKDILSSGLNEYMAFACQCGEHNGGAQAGVDMYQRLTGDTAPMSLSRVFSPRKLGYVLCLHQTGRQQFDEEDLFKAGQKMLKRNLQEDWLGHGQMLQAAMWLKIVYALQGETLTPLQTVLKAYDLMPKVARPDFVPAV